MAKVFCEVVLISSKRESKTDIIISIGIPAWAYNRCFQSNCKAWFTFPCMGFPFVGWVQTRHCLYKPFLPRIWARGILNSRALFHLLIQGSRFLQIQVLSTVAWLFPMWYWQPNGLLLYLLQAGKSFSGRTRLCSPVQFETLEFRRARSESPSMTFFSQYDWHDP